MPSKSKSQARLMAAVAHNPDFAKKVGIPVSVGKEFNKADKGKKFKEGGAMKHDDVKQDKAMIKKAFAMHDKQEHKGAHTNLSKLKKGGVAKTVTKEMEYDYKSGKKSFRGDTEKRDEHAEKEGKIVAKHAAYDKAMGYKAGGRIASKGEHSVQTKSKRGAEIVKMAKGGLASGHKSADGCAIKGKTKARAITMCGGGMAKGKK